MPNIKAKVEAKKPGFKLQLAAKDAEIAHLRSLLHGKGGADRDEWGRHLPQELRDQMAARALLAEWGATENALRRLGFAVTHDRMHADGWIEFSERIFGTPGVKAIMAQAITDDTESLKAGIMKRLAQTALHGVDGDSVRASGQLSKILDWNESDKHKLTGNSPVNLLIMLGQGQNAEGAKVVGQAQVTDPDDTIDAADFLLHEPGEATLVADVETIV